MFKLTPSLIFCSYVCFSVTFSRFNSAYVWDGFHRGEGGLLVLISVVSEIGVLKNESPFFISVAERETTESPVCAWKYSYYYVNEMLYKSMSENNDDSEMFKLSVFFHPP